jgi:hypothetical protein
MARPMPNSNETIRWPTNLDRAAIEKRLTRVAEMAAEHQLLDLSARFANVSTMSAAQIASNVVGALTWFLNQPTPERSSIQAISKELEMVALNLKNLK